MTLRIGVIADDFTGATDIAGFLVSAGLRTAQLNSPEQAPENLDADAVVISLKTRSIPADDAVQQSLRACRILQQLGAEQIIFKYCSTFDSTAAGNIGPVTDALLEELKEDFTVIVPALPVNGRTVYQSSLFVHHQPLHESGMKDHPVTPMTDSNLLRLMEAQSRGTAAAVPYQVVEQGPEAVRHALNEAKARGARYAVIDTLNHDHLDTIGEASRHLRLLTGGSGMGSGLGRALTGRDEAPAAESAAQQWEFTSGPALVISGSSSQMTNKQVAEYRQQAPSAALDVARVIDEPRAYLGELTEWVLNHIGGAPSGPAPMVYATAAPETVRQWQQTYGAERLSAAIEGFFGDLASGLRERGVTRFIVAGGETSGAVTQALGVAGFEVGPQIAPGVPWTLSLDGALDLALKSGNFGDEQFFAAAQQLVADGSAGS
ncbi:3-oxo-tetronate kinase [Nesterenkonia populi]|uniref:3-oxo-tetronate kinase n=1 Tax=Nesterenkonia populi TaxID=1591087 RepID=UPI0011BFE681|nr:3-oxo-tetronate kinase [Nesterenkonia populi]